MTTEGRKVLVIDSLVGLDYALIEKLAAMGELKVVTREEAEKLVYGFRQRYLDIAALAASSFKGIHYSNRAEERRQKKKAVIESSKTGAKWPKAKGAY